MRIHGTLSKWNDQKGFGFIRLPQSHEEVFVHISAFPTGSIRPSIGEIISFEIQKTADGKLRAVNIKRSGSRKIRSSKPNITNKSFGEMFSGLLSGIAIIGICIYGWRWCIN